MLISKTFCILPWIHFSTRPNGHIRVCCAANASGAGPINSEMLGGEIGLLKEEDGLPSTLEKNNFLECWNNLYMRSIRLKMLNGEIPDSCIKCFKEEESGYQSKRNWETAFWSRHINISELVKQTREDGTIPPKLYYLDLRLGNKCNLKCIMCSPHDSSMWVPDWRIIYPKIKNKSLKEVFGWKDEGLTHGGSYSWYKDNPQFWDQLYEQIPHMKQLYFAGGEATIIEAHYTFLEEVVKRGYAPNIIVRYNSNGLVVPDRLLELWDNFKYIRFNFSLDSFGEMNDYIRWPPNWDRAVANLHKLDNTGDNIHVALACAIQVLNIYYLPELIKWKLNQNFKKINVMPLGAGLVNTHLVYLPVFLNVKILPEWFKIKIRDKYEEFYKWLSEYHNNDEKFLSDPYGIERLKGLIKFLFSEDWSQRMPEFREYINLVDEVRGSNFRETFPEIKELLDE